MQCLFEPRVIEFDQKRGGAKPFSSPDVTDEIVEQVADHVVSCGALLSADAPLLTQPSSDFMLRLLRHQLPTRHHLYRLKR